MKTEVLFFFDTEDFTSCHAADAIYNLARIMTEEGVRGHFALVGLLARQLKAWGRNDVIRALEPHIIGSHTWSHSIHPNICELSDCKDFHEAYANVLRQEAEGVGLIRGALSRDDVQFAVPPGNSKSYAAMYVYADMGIPFYCDTVVTDKQQSELSCCNIRQIAYTTGLEPLAYGEAPDWDKLLNEWAEKDRVILFTHPNSAYYSEFWDGVNYRTGNAEWGKWKPCKERPAAESRRYFETFREEIRRIKADDRFQITTLNELKTPEVREITPEDLPNIKASLEKEFSSIGTWSLSDIFLACAGFLNGKDVYTPSKVYGFLTEPAGITEPCTVTRANVKAAAEKLELTGFLPATVTVGNQLLGAADYLFAMLEVLTTESEEIRLNPRAQEPSLDEYPSLKCFAPAGQWLHLPSFRDNYLSDRLRMQAWTMRKGY